MKIISKGKLASQIKPVRADSKKALILKATLKGVTIEDIMKLTGWAKSAASSAIATDNVADVGLPVGFVLPDDSFIRNFGIEVSAPVKVAA